VFDLTGIADGLTAARQVDVTRRAAADGAVIASSPHARIDTPEELVAFRHGGILPYVVRQLVARR
jgi:aconitate hydratase